MDDRLTKDIEDFLAEEFEDRTVEGTLKFAKRWVVSETETGVQLRCKWCNWIEDKAYEEWSPFVKHLEAHHQDLIQLVALKGV